MALTVEEASAQAEALDRSDPLAHLRDAFLESDDGVVAYFDGNSLGRPPRRAAEEMDRFVRGEWAGRLIRGWTDGWLEWPQTLGDRLGRVVLGAAQGQVVIADSTSVMLYKLARAAVDARPGRREIVLGQDDFPTDRYVIEGIAAERGLRLRWISTDPAGGVTEDQVSGVVGPDTALVVFSHVAYRSAWIADAPAVTRAAHGSGALVLWDLSHSVGVVDVRLDAWQADLAVGCTYKYLGGGPGSPAFGYVRRDLQDTIRQPIWGWMGRRDAFAMGSGYEPAPGVRSLLSGTPPILAMLPLVSSLDLLESVGMPAVRAKSVALTEFAVRLVDEWLVPLGVDVVSPREVARRGGHLTIRRAGFRNLLDDLWARGVLPDYRAPDGIRIGLSPLTTSFGEVCRGLAVVRELAAQEGPDARAGS